MPASTDRAEKAAAAPRISQRTTASIALGIGVLALCLSALYIRWADAPGMITSFYRMLFATAVMLPVFLHRIRQPGARPMSRADLWLPVLGGLFSALDHGFMSTSVQTTRVANATLLNNLSPIWVALVTWLVWKKRLSGVFWLGLGLSLAGAVIVFSNDLINNPHLGRGDLLAIFASLFYAGYFLATQRGREHFDTLEYTSLAVAACTFFLLLFNLAVGNPLSGYSTQTYLIFLAAALISQVTGYFAITYALGHLPAAIVSPTMIAQPVITALLAIPLFGEALLPAQWIGGLVVLTGIYLVNRH